ncbi:MAG: hypothetical protein ACK4HD_12420 [Pannonibacter phragmitetus]|uniref:DUF3035 domain-containing protein n=1 Tax=Pannonibacter phragmitetus TaxID=121719 RepID=A0A378ZXH9_9HYPH|nr:hypothetical protein [Pannonibacter phragmitetus]SUB01530.1 Uncharacterised protein [Pannonibacter phragmitetus]
MRAIAALGVVVLLGGCASEPDTSVFSMVSAPITGKRPQTSLPPLPPTIAQDGEEVSGVLDDQAREANLERLKKLSEARAAVQGGSGASGSAAELARLRDAHGQAALQEIEGQ